MDVKNIIKILKKQTEKDIELIKKNRDNKELVVKVYKRLKKVPKLLEGLYTLLEKEDLTKSQYIYDGFFKVYNTVDKEKETLKETVLNLEKLISKFNKSKNNVIGMDKLFLMKMMADMNNNNKSNLMEQLLVQKVLAEPKKDESVTQQLNLINEQIRELKNTPSKTIDNTTKITELEIKRNELENKINEKNNIIEEHKRYSNKLKDYLEKSINTIDKLDPLHDKVLDAKCKLQTILNNSNKKKDTIDNSGKNTFEPVNPDVSSPIIEEID